MRALFAGLGLTLIAAVSISRASARDVPAFISETYPPQAVGAAVAERQAVMTDGALDSKTKHLISLGVAAQIPCQYCVYFHTKAARAGATDAQIKEAIAAAALTRKWSTVLNGSAYDFEKMKREVDAAFARH